MEKMTVKERMAKVRAARKPKKAASTAQIPQPDGKPKTDTLTESPSREKAAALEKVAETFSEPGEASFLGIPLQEPTEAEKRLIQFKEFLNTHWGLPAVTVQFRGLFAGGYPPIPIPTRWQVPNSIDIEELTWKQVQTEKFIDEVWPSIVMMLGDDITNYEWAARIATVLSLFNIIKILPIVLEDAK